MKGIKPWELRSFHSVRHKLLCECTTQGGIAMGVPHEHFVIARETRLVTKGFGDWNPLPTRIDVGRLGLFALLFQPRKLLTRV
jgi:hypothetical protein